jgi:quinol monooxygenase YgiN
MTAFNVVRMRVKPGHVEEYLDFHRNRSMGELAGMRRVNIVQTGDRDFCFVGEWDSMEALAAARPKMIAILDGFRDRLEDLGPGLGVTDPVSGEVVIERHA